MAGSAKGTGEELGRSMKEQGRDLEKKKETEIAAGGIEGSNPCPTHGRCLHGGAYRAGSGIEQMSAKTGGEAICLGRRLSTGESG